MGSIGGNIMMDFCTAEYGNNNLICAFVSVYILYIIRVELEKGGWGAENLG